MIQQVTHTVIKYYTCTSQNEPTHNLEAIELCSIMDRCIAITILVVKYPATISPGKKSQVLFNSFIAIVPCGLQKQTGIYKIYKEYNYCKQALYMLLMCRFLKPT